MKSNKFFFIIFLYYTFLYQIVFETIIISQGIEITFTPLGRLFRYFFLGQDIVIYYKPDFYVFFFNILICAILYIVSFNWFEHFNTLKIIFKLIVVYIIISFLTWLLITWTGLGMGTIGAFIFLYLMPIAFMILLTIPFFWMIVSLKKMVKVVR